MPEAPVAEQLLLRAVKAAYSEPLQKASTITQKTPLATVNSSYLWTLAAQSECFKIQDGIIHPSFQSKEEAKYTGCPHCELRTKCPENNYRLSKYVKNKIRKRAKSHAVDEQEQRFSLNEANILARKTINVLKGIKGDRIQNIVLYGSFAHQILDPTFSYIRPTSDIDIILLAKRTKWEAFRNYFTEVPTDEDISSMVVHWHKKTQRLLYENHIYHEFNGSLKFLYPSQTAIDFVSNPRNIIQLDSIREIVNPILI